MVFAPRRGTSWSGTGNEGWPRGGVSSAEGTGGRPARCKKRIQRPGRRRGCLSRHCCGHQAGGCHASSRFQGRRHGGSGRRAVSCSSGCEWILAPGLRCAGKEGRCRWGLKIDRGRGRFRVRGAGDRLNQIEGWLQNQFPTGGAYFSRNLVGEHCQQRHDDHADEQEKRSDFHRRCAAEQINGGAADPNKTRPGRQRREDNSGQAEEEQRELGEAWRTSQPAQGLFGLWKGRRRLPQPEVNRQSRDAQRELPAQMKSRGWQWSSGGEGCLKREPTTTATNHAMGSCRESGAVW